MKQDSINTLLHIGTFLAVIAGMGLVVWEQQQTKELMRLQLSSDAFSLDVQYDAAFLGEDASKVEAKACTSPESLNEEEIFLLTRHYASLLQRIARNEVVEKIGNLGSDWERQSSFNFLAMFRTKVGRLFWTKVSSRFDLEYRVKIAGDKALANSRERQRMLGGCGNLISISDLQSK